MIRAINPDIIALQEVDSRSGQINDLDIFAYLESAVGGHSINAKTLSTDVGHYGQMLISRWPLRDCRIHDISVGKHEPRRIMEARVDLPGGSVRIIATHFGLNKAERRVQFRALADISKTHGDMPQVLMGDLNEWRRRGHGHDMLSPLFDICTSHRTYPAMLPSLALDRIWCRPGSMLVRSWTERAARHASDHLPLAADLSLRKID